MKKFFRLFLFALVALVFIGTFVFLYLNSRPKPVEYETLTPSVLDLSKTTVVTGKIEPRDEVAVKPQISGIITELLKEAGQRVEAGRPGAAGADPRRRLCQQRQQQQHPGAFHHQRHHPRHPREGR